MKKSIIFLLIISTFFLFSACQEGTTEPKTQSENLTINGVDLSQYTIVYARSPFYRVAEQLTTEYDFYKITAQEIAGRLKEITGVELTVKQDWETEETAYEILVGPTNRTESDYLRDLGIDAYSIKVVNTKLVIGGGYLGSAYTGNLKTSYGFASTYHAYDYLHDYVQAQKQEGKKPVTLPENFVLEGTRDITTIACIGDSITEGFATSNMIYYSYPAVLQRILWKDCFVINYGNSGKTMRDDLTARYRGTPQYAACMQYGQDFDIALIMLGTNDSYFDRAWTNSSDEAYNSSAKALVQDLYGKNENLSIFVMNCPVYYGNENSGSKRVRNLQAALAESLKADGYDMHFYDMYTYTKETLGRAHFPDLLHPDEEGYAMMAQGVADMLTAYWNGN